MQLGRYLDGLQKPSLDVALALADVLRVSPCWMLTGRGLPDPDGLTDHVRPLWRIDGPMGKEELPDTPEGREEAKASFEEGFASFLGEWNAFSPTVQLMFGNLLARRMLAARHNREPWHQAFWRGREAATLGTKIVQVARREAPNDGVPAGAPMGSPAYSDLLLRVIVKHLRTLRDAANPQET